MSSSKPEILKFTALSRRFRTPMRHAPVIGAAQKETELVPKSNRMPERSLGVKVDTPNCRASTFPGASKKRGPLRGPSFQRGRVAGIRGNSFWRRSGDRTDRSEVLENIESEEVPSGATSLSTTGLSICRTKLGNGDSGNGKPCKRMKNNALHVIKSAQQGVNAELAQF